jgi:phage baseplate assembly protein W
MATQTTKKIYSDIDFTFTRKPVTADVALSYDSQAVIRSIRNLLLTKHFERPFNPQIGSGLDILLFEPVSSITSSLLENEIRTTIENFEPRATLNEVKVTPDPDKNAYAVFLSFYIENSTLPTTVTLLLERNR